MDVRQNSSIIKPTNFFNLFNNYRSKNRFKYSNNEAPISFKHLCMVSEKVDTSWTKWMENLMQKIADKNNYHCFNLSADSKKLGAKEIMKIDHVFTNKEYDDNEWYIKAYPVIAVEHENATNQTEEKIIWAFWKLLHFNSQLKVLITYPDKEKNINYLQDFEKMIMNRNRIFKVKYNFLVIFGIEAHNNQWEYFGYELKNNHFQPLR